MQNQVLYKILRVFVLAFHSKYINHLMSDVTKSNTY